MPRLVFRCDGATLPGIGTGHVVRSRTLARALVDQGTCAAGDILFVTRSDGPYEAGYRLARAGMFAVTCGEGTPLDANSPAEAEALVRIGGAMVILDRLETSAAMVKRLRAKGATVVTMDDLGPGRAEADLAINAVLQDVPDASNLLKGYDYLILSAARYEPIPVADTVQRIAVTFGGFDAKGLTELFLAALPLIAPEPEIDLILGEVETKRLDVTEKEIDVERRTRSGDVSLHRAPADFQAIVRRVDLAVTSGGLTCFEFAALGIPTVSLPQYRHQLRTLERLAAAGATSLGSDGMDLSVETLARVVNRLIRSSDRRREMAAAARRLVDGRGLERVLAAVTPLIEDKGRAALPA